MSILCSMVGASFTVAAAAEVLRSKKGVTAVGNAQIDTAQSKFGGSSALFDGDNDYLVALPSSATTSDFTAECWFRPANTTSGYRAIFALGNESSGRFVVFQLATTVGANVYGVGTYDLSGPTSISANTWYHIALVRSSGTLRLYLNGAYSGEKSASGVSFGNTGGYHIGNLSSSTDDFNGHIDEFRLSDTARYTTTFTPSTTPFVNDANTVLLLHMDGTDAATFFEDDNGVRAQASVIANGNAQVDTAQSKFGGASAYFDGTGDYLEIPYHSSLGINSGNFTIEFWYYHPQTGIDGTYGDSILGQTSSGASGGWVVRSFANKLTWVWDGQGGYDVATFDPAANTWYHVAFVRSGTGMTCYVNGTGYTVTSYSNNTNVSVNNLRVGKVYTGQPDDYTGWIDEVRISNSARYTANFTAPTAPFVNDANTVLLLHMDGTNATTVFRDDNGSRSQKGIQSIGSAPLSTTQSKFGGTSLSLNGTNQRLETGGYTDLSISTETFTVECWFYKTDTTNSNLFGTTEQSTNNGFWLSTWSTGSFLWGSATSGGTGITYLQSSTSAWTTNTWNHMAVCRTGSTLEIFCNGNRIYTTSSFANIKAWSTGLGKLYVGWGPGNSGGTYNDSNVYWGKGYIDELRWSNVVRYSGSTYVTPTAPFQNDSNTVLLIHADGTNASTVITDDNGIAPYTP